MGCVLCERAEPAPRLVCVRNRLGLYTQRTLAAERSLRSCNRLKSDGVEMLRRVRKKSLYLGDSSDMDRALDQVRQSIVHVLDEWAKSAPDTSGMSAPVRSDWPSMIRRTTTAGSRRVGLAGDLCR